MRILIPTDAFPPVCGGSGWSTYELARGLRARGHEIAIVQPAPGQSAGVTDTAYDGFKVRRFGAPAPDIPYVRNYYKSERLTRSLARYLSTLLQWEHYEIVHAQHVMTTIAAIDAAKDIGVPVVATVRDYWPVCYWSDLLHTSSGMDLCPACTVENMGLCIRPRAGAFWPLALPMIPYMRANLAAKRTGLARADAVVAVSGRIAADLRARAPELAQTRVEIIPNPVNVAALRAAANAEPRTSDAEPRTSDVEPRTSDVEPRTSDLRPRTSDLRPRTSDLGPRTSDLGPRTSDLGRRTSDPYALYLGKLAPNKGTSVLIDVIARAELPWKLIVAGDGPDRAAIERDARASGRNVEFAGWVDKDAAARLLGGASMLIFPSRGPESLSRVLIEASALGVPIAAMDTGGTRDIIEPDVTGLLSTSPEGLAADVRRLAGDPDLRARLGDAARRKVERDFDAPAVVERIERLYLELVGP